MVFGITCPRCGGDKTIAGQPCDLCKGRGDQWMYRCPAALADPEIRGLARAYGAYQVGVLPDPGGLYDQSACFIHALSVFAAEKDAIEANERGK